MRRSSLRLLFWAPAILIPLVNLVTSLFTGVYELYSLIGVDSPTDLMEMIAVILCAFFLPAAPFAFLALICDKRRATGVPLFSRKALIGAWIGALLSVGGSWALIWVMIWIIDDAGAGLGYWGVLCSMLFYVPLIMLFGWSVGEKLDQQPAVGKSS
ncbi:MAG: hypothetical protein QGG36_18875 [Pirellulaceae bacterium]|jgi:hypothetical protein|nr:hypothetical protein [Pirellulaceae bacterium]MDP7017876.1 hypothetical protein [Pirellulaceae bacterium]